MRKNKNKIWNVNNYIMNMQRERANLKEEDLQNVSGGKINRKFLASTLTGLSFLMTVPTYMPVRAAETDTQSKVSESVKESAENVDVNRTLSKEEAIQDINFVLGVIKKYHVSAVEKLPDEVVNQKEIEINNLPEKITTVDEWRAIRRIISKLHDAHTMIYTPKFLDTRLPFSTACENDKFICTEGQFNGYEVAKINDITIFDNSTLEMRKTFPLYDGKIFVLTSHGTFSAAALFATLFSDNNLAKIIGEIPGNSPTCFSEHTPESYTTPNSKLEFYTSCMKFYRPDDSKSPDKLVPDIQVPADKAMDKAYEIIRNAK